MTGINIAPVKFSNNSFLKKIIKELNSRFRSDISLLALDLDVETTYSEDRGQFFSSQIIALSTPHTLTVPGKVLMITEIDLFVPVLTFVFGEAQLNGKHSLVSVCRLHEEFYSSPKTNSFVPALPFVFGKARLTGNLFLVQFCALPKKSFFGIPNDNPLF